MAGDFVTLMPVAYRLGSGMHMDRHACGGTLLQLPPETLLVEGRAHTVDLCACMACGEVTRTEAASAAWTVVQTV